jgi:CheY-like chemotaxis protein
VNGAGAARSEKAKILLVDDRPENLLALEAILSSLDQVLVRAGSGEEALRALLKDDFALILLDAQMPGMDGFETAARIKRRARTKDIPIIFLTAVDKDQQSSYRGYAAGGADYISKPFDPWILRAKVQVFVDLWAAGRRLATDSKVVTTLRERFAAVEEGVEDLVSRIGPADGGVAASVGRLQDRLEALRSGLSTLGEETSRV